MAAGLAQGSLAGSTQVTRVLLQRPEPFDLALERLLPKLRPLRPREILRRLRLGRGQARLELRMIGRQRRRSHLLAPDRKHPLRFAHRPEALAQLLAQATPADVAMFRDEFTACAADTLLGETMVHNPDVTPDLFQGERVLLLRAPRQIRSRSSGNSMPAAFAAWGNRLVAVMPGNEFASRHQNPPALSRRKSVRL